MNSTWNDLNDLNDPLYQQNNPVNFWDFESDLDPRIITQHTNLAFLYFQRHISNEELKVLMNEGVRVIQTPSSLFDRHITSIPISEWKAIDLAQSRQRYHTVTTVFEDPQLFYFYSKIDLILSKPIVDCYKIMPTKESEKLFPIFMGKRWAIFEKKSGSTFHFDWKKWSQLPAVNL